MLTLQKLTSSPRVLMSSIFLNFSFQCFFQFNYYFPFFHFFLLFFSDVFVFLYEFDLRGLQIKIVIYLCIRYSNIEIKDAIRIG